MTEIHFCENCLAGAVRKVATIFWKGCWLCTWCYDLSFDD